MFEFQWPWMFAVLILPVLIRKLCKKTDNKENDEENGEENQNHSRAASIEVPFLDDFISPNNDKKSTVKTVKGIEQILLITAWVFFVVALAKPVWVDDIANLPISGRNVIVAVDLSGSMSQRDFRLSGTKISRLAAIKKVATEFISKRVGDRIGLILFADHAYLQAPLTRDRKTVMTLLNEAELGLAGERTALGSAIALAVKKVQEKPDQDHVLVLMTDGVATVGINVDEAIEFAKQVGLKIYTIGIGSTHSKKPELAGRNKAIRSGLDDTTLKDISQQTGGLYFRAKSITQLQSIYQELDELEPIIDTSDAWHLIKDMFYIPFAASCLFIILLILFRVLTNAKGNPHHV